MLTSIPNLNLKALHAASLATLSPKEDRPTLEHVAVLDAETFVATDSYRLLITHDGEMAPGDLIAHAQSFSASDVLLINAATIAKMVKDVKAAKTLRYLGFALNVADGRTTIVNAEGYDFATQNVATSDLPYVSERTPELDFPNFGQLLKASTPAATGASFNPAFLADMTKFSKAAGGESNSPWTFWGGETDRKPTYWSSRAEGVSMLMLLMPVRVPNGEWSARTVEVAAA